jgi:hypothetical protein
MNPENLTEEQESYFSKSHEELLTLLGQQYVAEGAPWLGLPTGPTDAEKKTPLAVGRRLWNNLRKKMHEVICGKGDVAKAVDGMSTASGAALFEVILPGLFAAVAVSPFTTKMLAIILSRSIIAVGKNQLCKALATGDDSLLEAKTAGYKEGKSAN